MNSQNTFKVDFIGIAAAKSGTTWLANMLDEHPDICLSEPKEVCYFNREMNSNERVRRPNEPGPFLNKNHTKPLSWYQKHFQHCKKGALIGEFSPVYFYDPEAVYAIKRTFPQVKLIAVLRNPIDRAYSEYWMFRSSFKIENRSFEEALREKGVMYIEKGMYYKQLKKYLELFDRDQIHIVFYDDIKVKPEAVLKNLYRFLGVDDTFLPPSVLEKSNYAKEARIKGTVEAMNSSVKFLVNMRMNFIVRALRAVHFNKLLLRLITKRLSYPPLKSETRTYLRGIFREDIDDLEKLLSANLSHWK